MFWRHATRAFQRSTLTPFAPHFTKCRSFTQNTPPMEGDSKPNKEISKPPDPPPEGLCCGSGCANCVWMVYAEELMDFYRDGGKAALKSLEKVPDPNIREFLKMELKMKMK